MRAFSVLMHKIYAACKLSLMRINIVVGAYNNKVMLWYTNF